MSGPHRRRPVESRTGAAERAPHEINRPVEGDDPRWAAALARFAEVQRVFDRVNGRSSRSTCRERAYTYQDRAAAFNELAALAPLSTPVPFIRALFIAATSDAETAREYERRQARRGDAR